MPIPCKIRHEFNLVNNPHFILASDIDTGEQKSNWVTETVCKKCEEVLIKHHE